MSVTDINAVTPTTRQIVLTSLREEADTWLFVAKTLLAVYIAGWIAMRVALPQPSTAMLTTVIVANRQSGMVLAKSFYRAIGTLAGAVAALLIVALFPQERVLFLAALSLWVGLCSGGATLYRNFKSYGFVLAGYTAALISLPVIDYPPGVFDSAVARISEVLLGILVSGVVSDAVFPVRMRDVMRRTARENFIQFMQFVQRATGGRMARSDIENAHLRFVRDAVTLEDMRSSVIFEDPEARARSAHILHLNQCFMAASTSLQSLHHLINRLQRNGRDVPAKALIELYAPLGAALDTPVDAGIPANAILPRLESARQTMDAQAQIVRSRLAPNGDVRDFETGANLLHRFAEELHAYVDTAAKLQRPGGISGSVETIRFTRSNDFYSAGLATLRTTLVMAALAVFWIASAWPLGSFAMILATVFAGLFASAPNPARSVYTTFAGFFLGAVASFICEFFVLSRMDGYGLFVASSAPFLMVGLLMVTRPKLVNAGVGYTIGFTLTLAVKNQTVFDVVHFLNEMVADLVGLGAAAISFVFVLPTFGSPWFRHRQFELLRRQVSVAAQAPMPGLRHRFESLNHDLFVQIAAQTERGSKDSRALFAWALAVNETGRALIQLRSDMSEGEWPKGITLAITRAIDALARLYERPSAEAYQHAIETLKAAIGQVEQHDIAHPLLAHLHLLRMMLLDEESVLAQYMPPKTTAAGADHAT